MKSFQLRSYFPSNQNNKQNPIFNSNGIHMIKLTELFVKCGEIGGPESLSCMLKILD